MKNVVEEFIPFEHQNLEYINGSLNLARQQRQSGTAEGMMAATVIYTNLVEYLATNLLSNLDQMIFLLSYHGFNGVFFVKSKTTKQKRPPRTLGQLSSALDNFEFPDNKDFLSLLQRFSSTRNIIFHRLLAVSQEELNKGVVDQQFTDLHNLAEEILDKYNTITRGISTTWYSVTSPQQKQEPQTEEQIRAQIDALQGQLATLQTQPSELEGRKEIKKK